LKGWDKPAGKGLKVASRFIGKPFSSARTFRRWTAIARRPAVMSTLLVSLTGYGIGPHVQPDCDSPKVASPAARVAKTLAGTSTADRAREEATLVAAGAAERPYLLQALAAGHSADDLVRFARLIRGRKPSWLRSHLSLVDPDGSRWVSYHFSSVQQTDNTTCGSMTILMARAITDPLYALYLTTGNSTDRADASADQFQARLTAEEHRIHAATNRFWPQRLGSTPAGVTTELNRHADALGTRYESRSVTGGQSALRDAVKAADSAQPVPVLVGDWIPRHYILLIGREGGDLVFYEPSYATVDRVSVQNFLAGKIAVTGFHHIYAVVTPAR
jgi:hypothetical protein